MIYSKNKTYLIVIHILAIIGIMGLIWGCSPQYHFAKFQKKGGKIESKIDTLKIIDTVVLNGDTVVSVRDSFIISNVPYYLTKYEIKYKYKEKRDSFEVVKYQTKWKVKEVKIKEKATKSKSNWWLWLVVGIGVGLTIHYIGIIVSAFRNLP